MTEYNDQITFKISDERLGWIEDQVELRDSNRSEIIRRSLEVAAEAGLDYRGEGEKYDEEFVEDLEQTIERQRLDIEQLQNRLQNCEEDRERMHEELVEKGDMSQELKELEALVKGLSERNRKWAMDSREHKEALEEHEEKVDGLKQTVKTETGAVRTALGEEMERVRALVEKTDEVLDHKFAKRDERWDHRVGELAERLDAIEADLVAIQEDIEAKDDGGLF